MRLASMLAFAAVTTAVAAALCGTVAAQAVMPDRPVPRDPWVPPAVRQQAAAQPKPAPTRGAALQAQVERKLRASFDAADVSRTGRITREQAHAAGLGSVAEHFDQIDTQRQGSVSFEEVKRYLRSRGARHL